VKSITCIVEEFAPGTPAQQLLDRFLLGYPRDGEFHRLEHCVISAHLLETANANASLDARVKEHGLIFETNLERAITGADALAVIWRGGGADAQDAIIQRVLNQAAPGACCFVHGALGTNLAAARAHAALAASRGIRLLAGTPMGVSWRLPDLELPAGAAVKEALIVVQGASPGSELDGLEGILPILERRRGGESGVRAVRSVSGEGLWQSSRERGWSWDLLATALSRSDSPQGDAVTDGRTEDLVGLGLVPKLAREPRGWLIDHRDGLRSSILVLDGVVADCNIALQLSNGAMLSAQLYRPPKPAQHEFSRLASIVEGFFKAGEPPWPVRRSILTAGLLEAFRTASARQDEVLETPLL
jgi:hypothetical protein